MRRLRTLLCLGVLALPLQAGGLLTAQAVAIDADHVECTASGSLTTSPGGPQVVNFSGSLGLNCTGVGDDDGFWGLTFSGQMSPGFCAGGQGLANIGGNGPEGSVSGGIELTMSATSLHLEGTWSGKDPGGEAFKAALTATPTSGTPCVNASTQMNLQGEASITDLQPPPDSVACSFAAQETYTPGITPTLTPNTLHGVANMPCTNPVSDDQGLWQLTYDGTITADCGLSTGTVFINGVGPEGTATGSADYERVGTMLAMFGDITTGTADEHSFAVWAAVNFTAGNCVTVPWTAANVTGPAGMAE